MAEKTRRQHILDVASDLAWGFLCYDRKESKSLPVGEIEAAIEAGEITRLAILMEFVKSLGWSDLIDDPNEEVELLRAEVASLTKQLDEARSLICQLREDWRRYDKRCDSVTTRANKAEQRVRELELEANASQAPVHDVDGGVSPCDNCVTLLKTLNEVMGQRNRLQARVTHLLTAYATIKKQIDDVFGCQKIMAEPDENPFAEEQPPLNPIDHEQTR